MSSPTVVSLNYYNRQINIYGGFTILATGTLGGILNILAFLSLRTFRQSSCAFYLTIMSIVNIGQLYTGVLSRTMISGYGIDWTEGSLPYCKARLAIFQICTLVSYSCLCLATIDQYWATCSRPRWQQWCNIKLAQRLTFVTSFVWILHAIPFAVLITHVQSPSTGKISCAATNPIFLKYRAYFSTLILAGFLPVIITVTFGLLAFRNVQQLTHRAVPLVRRELDKQLTKMVLVQVLLNSLTAIPFSITNALTIDPSITTDAVIWAKLQFAYGTTLIFFYSYFASGFYIYMCASERFRRQLIHVIMKRHFNRWRQALGWMPNQTHPEG